VQRVGTHVVGIGEQRHALHHVRELADVARPRIREQRRFGVGGERLGGHAILARRAIEVVASDFENVAAPLAERRQADVHHRQAVIEVFTEAAHADCRRQIFAGRREHQRVRRFGACAAEAPHGAILDRLEQLRLRRVGHEADLVEKDRPAMRHLQQAGLGLLRIGEGATLEAEQLRLEQRVWNRRAIDIHERRRGPRTQFVNQTCDEPFTGTGFAGDQNRRQTPGRCRKASNQPRELLTKGGRGCAVPDELIEGHA